MFFSVQKKSMAKLLLFSVLALFLTAEAGTLRGKPDLKAQLQKLGQIEKGLKAIASGAHAPEGADALVKDVEVVLADAKTVKDQAKMEKEVTSVFGKIHAFSASLSKRQAELKAEMKKADEGFTKEVQGRVAHLANVDKALKKLSQSPLAPEGIDKMEAKVEEVMKDGENSMNSTDPEVRKHLAVELDHLQSDLQSFQQNLKKAEEDADGTAKRKALGGVEGAEERLFDELMNVQDKPIGAQLAVLRKQQYAVLQDAKNLLARHDDSTPLAEQFGLLLDKKAQQVEPKPVQFHKPTDAELKNITQEIMKAGKLPENVASGLAPLLAQIEARRDHVAERLRIAKKNEADRQADLYSEAATEKAEKGKKTKTEKRLMHELKEESHDARKETASAKAELAALNQAASSIRKGDLKGLKAAMATMKEEGGSANQGFLVLFQQLNL